MPTADEDRPSNGRVRGDHPHRAVAKDAATAFAEDDHSLIARARLVRGITLISCLEESSIPTENSETAAALCGNAPPLTRDDFSRAALREELILRRVGLLRQVSAFSNC